MKNKIEVDKRAMCKIWQAVWRYHKWLNLLEALTGPFSRGNGAVDEIEEALFDLMGLPAENSSDMDLPFAFCRDYWAGEWYEYVESKNEKDVPDFVDWILKEVDKIKQQNVTGLN